MPQTSANRPPSHRRQFSLRSLLLLVLGCALLCGLLFWWLRPPTLHRSYFPIDVGYRWVYQQNFGNTKDDVVFEVLGTEKVGGVECFAVQRTIGDHQIMFFVEVTDRAVLIHRVGDDRYTPPYPQFVFNSKRGDHWDWKGTIDAEPTKYACENLGLRTTGVPLGEWETFVISQTSEGTTRFWLADGIGVVRLEGKSQDKHDPLPQAGDFQSFDWQLKEFFRP
jgi:hypothetical protein